MNRGQRRPTLFVVSLAVSHHCWLSSVTRGMTHEQANSMPRLCSPGDRAECLLIRKYPRLDEEEDIPSPQTAAAQPTPCETRGETQAVDLVDMTDFRAEKQEVRLHRGVAHFRRSSAPPSARSMCSRRRTLSLSPGGRKPSDCLQWCRFHRSSLSQIRWGMPCSTRLGLRARSRYSTNAPSQSDPRACSHSFTSGVDLLHHGCLVAGRGGGDRVVVAASRHLPDSAEL
jgi:hypothetical protein